MSTKRADYNCWKCHKGISREELKSMPGIKCPFCGERILVKTRPPRIRIVKAK